jgi:hypothetical protein
MGTLISNHYDIMLLESGMDNFSVPEKNNFIFQIAQKELVSVNDVTDEFLVQYHKDLKINDFSNRCESDILKGFTSTTTGHTYRTSRDDQFNMFVEYIMTKDDPNVTEILYKSEDVGEQVSHTKEEFEAVIMEGFKHVKDTLAKFDELRKQIRACETDAEILAITW